MPARGRPKGLLARWLQCDRPTQREHKDMLVKKKRTAADEEDLKLEHRIRARQWLEDNHPDLDDLAKERPRRDGEGPEPEGLT